LRILVTGATGVVGRRLVPLLVGAGHAVTALGRSREKRRALEQMGAAPAEADLFDVESLRRPLAGQDAVINLATHIPSSSLATLRRSAWRENDRIRKEGSANLVEAARSAGVRRFLQESFAPIYPDRGEQWVSEETPLAPVPYNRTVLDAEASALDFAARGGTGVVLRFAAFYGPDSVQSRDLIRTVRHGFAPLPGAPDAFVSTITHDDAATAAAAALEAPSGAYNVADDEPLRRREFLASLARALGVVAPRQPPVWAALLMGTIGEMLSRSLRISNRKLRGTTGWAPGYPSAREGWPAVVSEMTGRSAAHADGPTASRL
jgi:nucleoside-diphosphate-sugar epimerase